MTAQDVVATLAASPTEPTKALVSGGIGSGKSLVLGGVRAALRAAGIAVIARAPRDGDPPGAAVVVDDAHLLDDAELQHLADLMTDPATTVIVATEPQSQHAGLTALSAAAARQSPVVTLGPLTPPEIARLASEVIGSAPPLEMVRSVATATAGVPFLVRAAVTAAAAPDAESPGSAISAATRAALIERLRRADDAVVDTLLICSLSPELGPDDVAGALDLESVPVHRLVDRARATGLIAPSYNPIFLRTLHRCLAQIVGATRHHEIETRLLRTQLDSSTLTVDLALRMADHGLRDPLLADALTALADRNRAHPARTARLYRAAAEVDPGARDSRLADALAASGDCATAGRIADELLTSEDAGEKAAAVRIAASVAVHDGSATQAAELFAWLGPHPDAVIASANAVVAIGVGDPQAARAALAAEAQGPPTSDARAARHLAEGLIASLDSPYPTAMARLSQAISARPSAPGVTPDSAAAVVALTALHAGDPVRARSVVGRALAVPGDEATAFFAHRHRLLLGWIRMLDGQLAAAGTDVAAVTATNAPLHRRDALWASALQTAIARRNGDSGAVQKHWYAAMEVLTEYSIDLYSLLPLGELWIAAARLHQVERLTHTVDEAFDLLGRLGNPIAWSLPLHWAGVHAGILANSPDAVAPHGQALTAAAAHSTFARSLAHAGRTWLRVLANHVEVDEVTAAARSLAQFGLGWDATRLASQAALQTPDGRVSAAMLQLARDLKVTSTASAEPAPPAASAPTSATATAGSAATPDSSMPNWSRLSDREREVAELVLQGMPYRDIGSQLLISAKTVEHHVARIRRRLGAESRSELMSMLRAILATPS